MGNYLIFRRAKGGIQAWLKAQKRGSLKLWKGSEGGPLKFTWKMKTCGGGIARVIKSYQGGSLQWSNIQRRDRLNFSLFSPKSSGAPPPRPPPAIINDQSLRRLVTNCSQKPIRSQDYQFDTGSRYIGSCWANCPSHSWHHSFYWREIQDFVAAKTYFFHQWKTSIFTIFGEEAWINVGGVQKNST